MNLTFLFDSDSLYLADGGLEPETVEPMTLECYEVKHAGRNFLGGNQIEFKIKGRGEILYRTSYTWALVLNTPENLKAVEHRNNLRRVRNDAAAAANAAHDRVIQFA